MILSKKAKLYLKNYFFKLFFKKGQLISLIIICILSTQCYNKNKDNEINIIKKTVVMYANELSKSYLNHQLNFLQHITTAEEFYRLNVMIKSINKNNNFSLFISTQSIKNAQIISNNSAIVATEETWIQILNSPSKKLKNINYSYSVTYNLKKEKGIWKIDKIKMKLIK